MNFFTKLFKTGKSTGKIEIFKGANKQFYFRVKSGNNEIIAVSESYLQKEMCEKGIKSLKKNINSEIIDLT